MPGDYLYFFTAADLHLFRYRTMAAPDAPGPPVTAVETAGGRVLYLPPHSADLDPMEDVWSKLKQHLRSAKARTFDALVRAVGDVLRAITASDLLGFFEHRDFH